MFLTGEERTTQEQGEGQIIGCSALNTSNITISQPAGVTYLLSGDGCQDCEESWK